MIQPTDRVKLAGLGLAVLLLSAGCGAAAPQPAPSATPPAPAASQPTAARAASQPAGASEPAAPPPAQKAPTGVSACNLLTKEEVSAAIGRTVLAAKVVQESADFTQCSYEFGSPGGPAIFVEYERSKGAQDAFQMTKSGAEAVTGIGDEAYWHPGGFALSARVNGGVLRVNMVASDITINGGDLKTVALRLATTAAGRI